ncbi:MAG: hypothetical protein WDZ35_05345 [Crocinitomicaceae bacterium]
MAKKETQKSKKIKEILLGLASKEENKQIEVVKSLKLHGDETVLEPLIQLWIATGSTQIKSEIEDLLNTIKSTKVPEKLIACLNNPSFSSARQMMLASIWNSGLDYRPYLGDIATATVQGDFMDVMECITILENIEGQLNEEEIMDALLVFKTYLVDKKDEEGPKVQLIKEMVISLQELNDNV